jgi:hypothetical protein
MTTATTYAEALAELQGYMLTQFNTARAGIAGITVPAPPATLDDATKKALGMWQAQMSSSITQLGGVEGQRLANLGNADVAALMHTIATTAAAVCLKIGDLMTTTPAPPTTTQATINSEITTLTGVLTALANLSPAANWQQKPTGAAAG